MGLISGKKSLFWKTGIDNKGLDRDAKKTKGILGGLSKGAKLVGVAFLAAAAAGVILAKQLKKIISAGMPFGETMSHVLAVTRALPSEFRALRESAMELGATTAFTATQVASMQVELAKLGFTSQEILKVTAPALDAAAASGSSLAEVAAVAAGNLRVFGIEAQNMQRVTDVMAESFASSALDLEKFKESSKSAAPMADAFGLSIEQMTALLGKLADKQIAGSIAGIGLKNVFSQLKNEDSSLSKVLGGSANTWEEFIELLIKAKKRGKEFNDEALAELDKRIQPVIINLVKSSEGLEEYAKQLENAEGAAKKMADTRLDNLAGDVKILNSAMEGLYLTLYDKIQPALRRGVKFLTAFASSANKFIKSMELPTKNISKFDQLTNTYNRLSRQTELNSKDQKTLNDTIDAMKELAPGMLKVLSDTKAGYEKIQTAIEGARTQLLQFAKDQLIYDRSKAMADGIAVLTLELDELYVKLDEMGGGAAQWQLQMIEGLKTREELEAQIAKVQKEYKDEMLSTDELNILTGIINHKIYILETQKEMNDYTERYSEILDRVFGRTKKVADEVKTLSEEILELTKSEFEIHLKTFGWDKDSLIASIESDTNDAINEINDDEPELEIIPTIPDEELTIAGNKFKNFMIKNGELIKDLGGMITDSISDSLADAIIEGEANWEQFIKNLEKQLLASAIQGLFFKLLGIGSGAGFAGLFGNLFGGGGTTQSTGGFSSGDINNYVENGVNYSIPNTRPDVNVNSNPIINNDFSRLEKRLEDLSTAMQNSNFVLKVNNKQAGTLYNTGSKFNAATRDK